MWRWFLLMGVVLGVGCSQPADQSEEIPARPVSVLVLTEEAPALINRVSGSVGSWKVEDIGFEVSGRVTFVIEPETDIEGRDVWIASEQPQVGATKLAQLDTSRYDLKVNSAKAQTAAIVQQIKATEIERDDVIPSQIIAAEAELTLAKDDFNRKTGLFQRDALSKQELETAKAQFDTAKAKVAQLNATKEAKRAEVTALLAQKDQQQNDSEEAARNVADCTLHSPFRGQVASVHVIPGGYVERGQPVITVQMMDPIKIEFEVSAETVRKLPHKMPVPISFVAKDGTRKTENAFIYQTDPTADPETRTFTVTLLMRNEKHKPVIPEGVDKKTLATTPDVWRMHKGIEGAEDSWFIDRDAIHAEEDGSPFLWRIKQPDPEAENLGGLLEVEKVRIQRHKTEISLIDLYHMVHISLVDEADDANREMMLFTDKLTPPEKSWDGKSVLLELNQWKLRPGDLVNVHLDRKGKQRGMFVPFNCVKNEPDGQSVFVVETANGKSVLKRTPVKVFETAGTKVRIEPVQGEVFKPGTCIVAGRVHYLQDGEPVRIAETLSE